MHEGRARRTRSRPRRGRPLSAAGAWALRAGLFVFCAFPLYWMLVSSLKVSHELLAAPPTFVPHEWDLRAYRKLFVETNFLTYFQNTVIVAALTTVIVIVAAGVWGASLSRYAISGPPPGGRMTLPGHMCPAILMLVTM